MTPKFISADPILNNIIQHIEIPIFISTNNVFHDLVSCIIEQQIHYRSTKKIFAKALAKSGIEQLQMQNVNLLEKHGLPSLALSNAKYETLHATVQFFTNNDIAFQSLSNQDIIAVLSTIKGIGIWTIHMILLYTLQRPNIFPADDYHLKQIMISLYHLNTASKLKAQMIEIAKQWGDQQSKAVLYLLAYKKMV
jgi:DNA-3-methyladenine glycosylase II